MAMRESAPMRAPDVLLVDPFHGGISECPRPALLRDKRSDAAPNTLKPSLQSLIDGQHVTLSEGRPYGLLTRTVTMQSRDGGPVPAVIGWDQEEGCTPRKRGSSRTCRWIVER